MTDRDNNYIHFKRIFEIAVSYRDDVCNADIIDDCHDWYTMFKETNHKHPLDWIQEHLTEVTRDTHDYWLNPLGVAVIRLEERVNSIDGRTSAFQIAGYRAH